MFLKRTPTTRTDLDTCMRCGRDFVVPMTIVQLVAGDRCVVELHCNNCGTTSLGTFHDSEMRAFDRRLDDTQRHIREAVEAARAADELDRVDRFARALHAGHILPEDF